MSRETPPGWSDPFNVGFTDPYNLFSRELDADARKEVGPPAPCWWCNDPDSLREHVGKQTTEPGSGPCEVCWGATKTRQDSLGVSAGPYPNRVGLGGTPYYRAPGTW